MPLYEYHCQPCDVTFEILIRSASDQPSCPKCRSMDVEKQFSVPAAAQTTGGRPSSLPLSTASNGPQSFGCDRPQCGSGRCAGLG
jgi:putative FmdB family regulatory protein